MKRLVVVATVWAVGLAGVLASVVLAAGPASAGLPAAVVTPGGSTSLAPSRMLGTRSGVGASQVAVAPRGTAHRQGTGRGGATAYADLAASAASTDETIRAATISASDVHSCALTTGGAVKCWGGNWSGQLGDGTTTDSSVPVDVLGLDSGVVAVSAGMFHSCIVTTVGAVKCWGYNVYGQLGDGTRTSSSVPVGVVGLDSGVVAVSAGMFHSCAVTTVGAVKCWGYNVYGQLGDGTTTNSLVPVGVVGLDSGADAVSASGRHSCAVTTDGAVKCWGDNGAGELGDGTTTSSSVPVGVFGLSSGVVAVSAGAEHSCAVTTAGALQCWGSNGYGALGDGTGGDSSVPVGVVGLGSGVVAVSAGSWYSCAVTTAGAVKCWGDNFYGQLGDGTGHGPFPPFPGWPDPHYSSVPVGVVGLGSGAVGVSAGEVHSCAVTTAGGVQCWGNNGSGQQGDGTTTESWVPVEVAGLGVAGVTRVSDFDGDAITDLVARDTAGRLWLYPGDGAGGFGVTRQMGSGWNIMTAIVTPGDVTGDTNADIIARDTAGRLWLYPGNGAHGLGAGRQIGSGWNGYTITNAADLDGAGCPDLLARDPAGALWLYPLSGNAVFGTRTRIGPGWNGYTIWGPGDFSGDGNADILVRSPAGALLLYRGNGTGGVAAGIVVGSGWQGMSAVVTPGNWNRGGGNDVLARNAAGELWFYPGDNASGFMAPRLIGSGWNVMTYIG